LSNPVVVIDSRESKSLKYAAKVAKIPHVVKSLAIGDLAYIENGQVKCLVERKKTGDLLNSVIMKKERVDGSIYHRYTYQLKLWFSKELDNVPCFKMLGIVGAEDPQMENVFYGALASSGIRIFDMIFWVENDTRYLKTAYSLIKALCEDKWQLPPHEKRPGFDAIICLQDLIGQQKAVKIVERFKTLQGVANAKQSELEEILSKQGAKKVYGFFR